MSAIKTSAAKRRHLFSCVINEQTACDSRRWSAVARVCESKKYKGHRSMYTGKADRNAVYKTHKFFNRECKKGRSLFFLSVISAAAILAGTVLTGCSRADDLVQEQTETENYALTVFTAQERKEWEPVNQGS